MFDINNLEEDDSLVDVFGDIDSDAVTDSIDEDVDLEKLVASISKIKEEVEFLKALKKRRAEPIDAKIEKLTNNEAIIRDIILDLMPQLFPKKKTVDFPGVGKITRRSLNGKWEVTDEMALAKEARKHGQLDELFDKKLVLKKKFLSSVIAEILKDEDEVDGVEFVEPESEFALTVTLEKESDE
jgi:hypothetical protein